jgi:hypothetical protein
VRASDIEGDDKKTAEVVSLSNDLARAEALAAKWRAKMDNPAIVDPVAAKLTELNTQIQHLRKQLAEAEREATATLAEAWGEFGTLAGRLNRDTSDEMKEKVRAALRRAIESVTCLFVGAGRARVAAVRVQFRGGDLHRDYVVYYDPPRSNAAKKGSGRLWVKSFAEAGCQDALDLRKPKDAAALEEALARVPLTPE